LCARALGSGRLAFNARPVGGSRDHRSKTGRTASAACRRGVPACPSLARPARLPRRPPHPRSTDCSRSASRTAAGGLELHIFAGGLRLGGGRAGAAGRVGFGPGPPGGTTQLGAALAAARARGERISSLFASARRRNELPPSTGANLPFATHGYIPLRLCSL